MPTTIISVGIFLILLGPGFCFVAVQDRRFPARDQSPFHEAVAIGAWSILLNAFVAAVATVVTHFHLVATIDAEALSRDTKTYWLSHFRLVNCWALALLAAACLLGVALGALLPAHSGRLSETSWWKLSHLKDQHEQLWVGCVLDDGAFIRGQLWSYNPGPDETPDRDLIVRDPHYRSPNGDAIHSMGVAAVCISASKLRYVTFSYLTPEIAAAASSQFGTLADSSPETPADAETTTL
jgi:hypothetical protein